MKQMELSDKIKSFEIISDGNTLLKIVLSAGNDNVNPILLLNAFEEFLSKKLADYSIKRTMLYTEDMEIFR